MPRGSLLDLVFEPGGLRVLFQPILELSKEGEATLHAFECLARGPRGTILETPEVLFQFAREKGEEAAVDRACIAEALREARGLGDVDLSLNVHASTLATDLEFLPFLADSATKQGVQVSRLIVEIVEHAPLYDSQSFRANLRRLRDVGVRVALDDIGLGYSNFRMIVECRPDYFKIDRYFVKNAHSDFYCQAVLDSVAHLAAKVGGHAVAEGVENEADLECVQALGIEYAQGYLFQEPAPASELGDLPRDN